MSSQDKTSEESKQAACASLQRHQLRKQVAKKGKLVTAIDKVTKWYKDLYKSLNDEVVAELDTIHDGWASASGKVRATQYRLLQSHIQRLRPREAIVQQLEDSAVLSITKDDISDSKEPSKGNGHHED